MKRKLFLTLGIAPVLVGAALAAGATLASPPDSASANSCQELAYGALYNGSQGNYDYGGWLLQLAIDMGCFS